MSEFSDPDLRRQLDRLGGTYPDDNAAFAEWQRRVGQAHRRRSVAWIAGAAMALIVATVGVAALQQPARHSLVPGKSPESSEAFTTTTPTTEGQGSSTTESAAVVTSAPTTLAPVTAPSITPEVESSLPEPEATESAGSLPTGGLPTRHGTPTSAPDASQSTTQTFSCSGGSITVRQDGDRLRVVGIDPAAGFRADEEHHFGSIEVTFRSWEHRFTITVKLVDGVMRDIVSEGFDTHDDSVPNDTSSGGGFDGGGYGGGGGYGDGGSDRGGGGYSGGGER
jgi:uncharacterized membrane protein YgcG